MLKDPEDLIRETVEAHNAFLILWDELTEAARQASPIVGSRIDAYQPFTRDQGMGDGPMGWFDEAASAFDLTVREGWRGDIEIEPVIEDPD